MTWRRVGRCDRCGAGLYVDADQAVTATVWWECDHGRPTLGAPDDVEPVQVVEVHQVHVPDPGPKAQDQADG